MGQGILLSGADEIDFMIHGVFSYELFGQTLWITTSHVCAVIVFLVILLFIFAGNRAMKKGTEIPAGFQSGTDSGKAGRHRGQHHGKECTCIPKLYRYDLHFHSCQQYFRSVWAAAAYGGLRDDAGAGIDDVYADNVQQV